MSRFFGIKIEESMLTHFKKYDPIEGTINLDGKDIKYQSKIIHKWPNKEGDDKNLYVYEIIFEISFVFIYTYNTCGMYSDLDKLANDWNKNNVPYKKINILEYMDDDKEIRAEHDVIFYENTNKIKLAMHTPGEMIFVFATELKDLEDPGKIDIHCE
jgi:hypothetical protein